MNSFDFFINMKNYLIGFVCLIFCFCLGSCCSAKPVATTHTERIEERVMPVAVGADTIEIVLNVGTRRAVSYQSPDRKSDTPNEQNQHNERANARQDAARCVPTIEAVRSTRALNITKTKTDTTSTLRITLQPDTVFVPYTNHIRSDTIVVPDRICKTKLQKTQTANALLILILIMIFIIFIKRKHFLDWKTR